MARFRIQTADLADLLIRTKERDPSYHEHLINDFAYDSEWCYPIIDRDRGPKQPEGSDDANLL